MVLSQRDKTYWRRRGANFIRAVMNSRNNNGGLRIMMVNTPGQMAEASRRYTPDQRRYWLIGAAQELRRRGRTPAFYYRTPLPH